MIDPLSAVTTGIGVVQGIAGLISAGNTKKRINRLLAQRKAYKTPQEIYDILNATQANAGYGYDPQTLNYLTGQTDQAFAGFNASAERMGADPNTLSAGFHEKVNSIMKIGAENHMENMKNFSAYLGALGTVAENKSAEWRSQQDIIKDKLQSEGVNMASATGNISGGINTVLAGLAANQQMNLYNPDGTLKIKKPRTMQNSTAISNAENYNAYNTFGGI